MNPKALRKRLGLTQGEFWARVKISQSAGSRYESGRRVPGPVRLLLDIAYGPAGVFAARLRDLRQQRRGRP